MTTMKRPTTLLLLLCCTFLAFGYTTENGDGMTKIYLRGNLLVRTTPGIDIRFYDIANPASVRQIGSLAIQGNSDVAVSGDYLYADRERDLVVYDISNPAEPKEVNSFSEVFRIAGSQLVDMANGNNIDGDSFGGASGCGEGCNTSTSSDDDRWDGGAINDPLANGGAQPTWNNATSSGGSNSSGGNTGGSNASSGSNSNAGEVPRDGTGGSLARFLIVANRLYTIDDQSLTVYDISNPAEPKKLGTSDIANGIETIFFANYHLFIGGRQGVYIYDVEDNMLPEYRGEFQHVERCDPVVVDGDYAYVTLRGGSRCGGWDNQMDILDVSDVSNPRLLNSYTKLDSPYGLAVRNGTAFVCDGNSGLRVLDVSDPYRIKECRSYRDILALDVIWHGDLLIVNTGQGFYLYDASDPCDLKEFGLLF